ncbi:NTP transferase domain-containing protein [Candidatus Dojkabacteria bacterium]|uniref:UTP--glucose-1-phosphate uridylyltransferase n=1 Tax=Candidatus Dojkabacteria bacterium TaxID=2099670 RepID=A0A955L5S8_9BACT|nr:NTP transferase domain-containing protein [Candidatus Dojkabacteria bacterium]
MAKVKTAVITAAGFGTRFLPIVKSIPKEMLPIVDKPILQYVVEECIEAEIENIIVVVREGNDVIENYFTTELKAAEELLESVGKGDRYEPVRQLLSINGLKFVNQREDLPYGNGTPIISAKHLIPENEPFAVLFADDLVLAREKGALRQIIETFEEHDPIGIVGVQKTPKDELYRYGIVEPSEVYDEKSGVLDMIIEKPEPGEEPSDLAVFGRYVVSYDVFNYLKEDATGKDNELWLTDANDKLSRDGKFMYKVVDGKWMTTGDPARYFEAQVNYFLADPRYKDGANDFLQKLSQ